MDLTKENIKKEGNKIMKNSNVKSGIKKHVEGNNESSNTKLSAVMNTEKHEKTNSLLKKTKPSKQEIKIEETEAPNLEELIAEASNRGFEDMPWWFDVPKKFRMHPGDVIYHTELDRFGIFISPARKNSLVRIRLLKVASKLEVYTRDWFVPFESLILVKHENTVKRGFVETDHEYVRRAGKIARGFIETDISAV